MNSPVALVPKPTAADEVKESVVRLLRDTLAEAERGNVDCVIMIVGHPDGAWSDRCSSTTRMSEAIGRLEITKQEWVQQYLENRE
jgi:hypothetical protein